MRRFSIAQLTLFLIRPFKVGILWPSNLFISFSCQLNIKTKFKYEIWNRNHTNEACLESRLAVHRRHKRLTNTLNCLATLVMYHVSNAALHFMEKKFVTMSLSVFTIAFSFLCPIFILFFFSVTATAASKNKISSLPKTEEMEKQNFSVTIKPSCC